MYDIWRQTCTWKAKNTGHLPNYLGSSLRGILGNALMRVACSCPHPQQHQANCQFKAIFKANSHCLEKINASPSCFVSIAKRTPTLIEQGEYLHFDVIYFSPAWQQRQLIKQALAFPSKINNKASMVHFEFVSLEDQAIEIPQADPDTFSIQIQTPLFIKCHAKGGVLQAKSLDLYEFGLALKRRLDNLNLLYHAGLPQITSEDLDLLKSIDFIDAQLQQEKLFRYSHHQNKKIPMRGIQGAFRFKNTLTPLLQEAFYYGQYVHLGGKTALGLGKYTLLGD